MRVAQGVSLVLAGIAAGFAGAATAQVYPSRTVTIVVPYTPGTGADILSRILGPRLAERWKVGVVTDNRAGATGNIGTEFVARSAPDGYTLLFAATAFGTNPAIHPRLPFDPVKNFAPVALVVTSVMTVVVSPKLGVTSLREFLDAARSQPGKLHYASPGNGGPQHLAMELLKQETGVNLVHVPYKGMGGAINDLVGGHVQAAIVALQTAAPYAQSGKLRMLAVMSAERSPAFADVPTLKELGLRGPRGRDVVRPVRPGRDAGRDRGDAQRRGERAARPARSPRAARQAGHDSRRRSARAARGPGDAGARALVARGRGRRHQGRLK